MPVEIPATIQAEDYSNYLDLTTGNAGGAYRNDNVDVQATMDTGGGYNVGWIDANEWLEYEITAPAAGTYTASVRVASNPGGGKYILTIDGAQVGAAQDVGKTGGWQSYVTQSVELGTLAQGSHILRLQAQAGNFNVNWLELKAVATDAVAKLPGRIEAENYQRASDFSAGNTGGQLRNDDVDVRATSDNGGGYAVGWTEAGEWLEYDVNVAQAGSYDVDVRVSSGVDTGKLQFEVDDVPVGSAITIPSTGSWKTWTTTSTSLGQLAAGDHRLRLAVTGSQFDVNWLDVKASQVTSADQCDFTSECKAIYGDRATDCKNSRSEQSICMCGPEQCSDNPTPTPPAPPTPTPPTPTPPTPTPDADQCDTTAQCKAVYGNSATDCKNSASEQSICMCGSSPCSGNPTPTPPNPTPPTPTPPTPPGNGTLGKFDKSKDLFLAFFDNMPDADDIHSQAGVATLLLDRRFQGVDFFSVLGTYGRQNSAFLNSSSVMTECFGNANWSNAHPKDGANWNSSLTATLSRVNNALARGGDVWIMEAGQSDFTADLLRRLKSANSNINTKNRIHVVQHSDWNEDQTTPADLNYTRSNTDYTKIPDGNASNNGSPQFLTRNGSNWNKAISLPTVGKCWAEARRVADANNFNGGGHYENPAIESGGFDFSDVTEATWIFGFNSLVNVNSFFNEFPKINTSTPTPPAPPTPPSSGGAFVAQNGLLVVDMESLNAPSGWTRRSGNNSVGGYLEWTGPDRFGAPGTGVINIKVRIDNPGTYRFLWRTSIRNGQNTTEHNDTWLKILANNFYGLKQNGVVCPRGKPASNRCSGKLPEGSSGDGWFKIYRSGGPAAAWTWSSNTSDNDAHAVYADFDRAGTYEIQVSGRSKFHAIDRFVMFRERNSSNNVSMAFATNTARGQSPRD